MKWIEEAARSIECPSCGYALPLYFRYSKLVRCPACGSDIFLEDDAVRVAGESSVPSDEPSLLKLHTSIEIEKKSYLPVGHIRYTTGPFFWDEWWLVDGRGDGVWLSVDDGDYMMERKIDYFLPEDSPRAFTLGRKFGEWIVTEVGEGICESFEGELPELIELGERFVYAHLSTVDGRVMSAEFYDGKASLFSGKWRDPYEMVVLG